VEEVGEDPDPAAAAGGGAVVATAAPCTGATVEGPAPPAVPAGEGDAPGATDDDGLTAPGVVEPGAADPPTTSASVEVVVEASTAAAASPDRGPAPPLPARHPGRATLTIIATAMRPCLRPIRDFTLPPARHTQDCSASGGDRGPDEGRDPSPADIGKARLPKQSGAAGDGPGPPPPPEAGGRPEPGREQVDQQ
jgi:hypothetical protein